MNRFSFNKNKKTIKSDLQRSIAAANVIVAFDMLINKKAILLRETTIELFPELWGIDYSKALPWMENAYMYCRMKLNYPKGTKLDFIDIETGIPIGHWNGKKAELI